MCDKKCGGCKTSTSCRIEIADIKKRREKRDADMLAFLEKFAPCPFCGRDLKNDLDDSFYPTGTKWEDVDCLGDGQNVIRRYLSLREPLRSDNIIASGSVYGVYCATSSGGCGAELSGDSPEEVLARWNTRV